MQDDFLSLRIAKLRNLKGVSARDMSLTLGQNENYINLIENGKSFPSMQAFFYICEYFKITPKEFFDDEIKNPEHIKEAVVLLNKLNSDEFETILNVIKYIAK